MDPGYFPALRELALLLPEDSPERRSLLEQAAAVRDDVFVLNELGDLLMGLGEHERALAIYQRAQAHRPNDRTAYEALARACRALGREGEARAWEERWCAVDAARPRWTGRGVTDVERRHARAATEGSGLGKTPVTAATTASRARQTRSPSRSGLSHGLSTQ